MHACMCEPWTGFTARTQWPHAWPGEPGRCRATLCVCMNALPFLGITHVRLCTGMGFLFLGIIEGVADLKTEIVFWHCRVTPSFCLVPPPQESMASNIETRGWAKPCRRVFQSTHRCPITQPLLFVVSSFSLLVDPGLHRKSALSRQLSVEWTRG
jgi:hypothetical protein